MKKLHFGKRLISLGLTLAMMLTSAQFALPVQGADDAGYYRTNTGDNNQATQKQWSPTDVGLPEVVENGSLDYTITKAGSSFADKPFLFDPDIPDSNITITGTGSKKTLTITSIDKTKNINITPQLQRNATTVSGSVNGKDAFNNAQLSLFNGGGSVTVIGNVSLSFTVTIDPNTMESPTFSLITASDTQNRWSAYNGKIAAQDSGNKFKNDGYLYVVLNPDSSGDVPALLVKIPFPQITEPRETAPNMFEDLPPQAFNINLNSASGAEPRSITVHKQEDAVNILEEAFKNPLAPNTNPLPTYASTGNDVNKLVDVAANALFQKQGDDTYLVNNTFKLASQLYLYSSRFKIDWTAAPNDYFTIGPAGDYTEFKLNTAKIPPTNERITLTGKVVQMVKGKEEPIAKTITMTLVLLGKGDEPFLKPVTQHRPTYKDVQIADTVGTPMDADAFDKTVKMDAYAGSVQHMMALEDQKKLSPNYIVGNIQFGTQSNFASRAEVSVKSGDAAAIAFFSGQGVDSAAKGFPLTITNPNNAVGNRDEHGEALFTVQALKKGTVTLEFTFFSLETGVEPFKKKTVTFQIEDNSPKPLSRLASIGVTAAPIANQTVTSSLEITGFLPDGYVGATPDPNPYRLEVDWYTNTITLNPTLFPDDVSSWSPDDFGQITTVASGFGTVYGKTVTLPAAPDPTGLTEPIPLGRITLSTPTETGDTTSYTVEVYRKLLSDVTTLTDLRVTGQDRRDDNRLRYLYLGNDTERTNVNVESKTLFVPATKAYTITVPFGETKVRIDAEITNTASTPEILLESEANEDPSLIDLIRAFAGIKKSDRIIDLTSDANFRYLEDDDYDPATSNLTVVYVKTTAQNGTVDLYKLSIIRGQPMDTHKLKFDAVTADTTIIADTPVDLRPPVPNENQTPKTGYINIPYSTKKVSFTVSVDPAYTAKEIRWKTFKGDTVEKRAWNGIPVVISIDNLQPTAENLEQEMFLEVWVVPESGKDYYAEQRYYKIDILRNDPEKNGLLSSLKIVDSDTQTLTTVPAGSYTFNKNTMTYAFRVPYLTSSVDVFPTAENAAQDPYLKMYVGYKGERDEVRLDPITCADLVVGANTITVEVIPEKGEESKKTYTVTITREPPSSNALLDSLTVTAPAATGGGAGGAAGTAPTVTLTPAFSPGNTGPYHISIPEGVTTVDITAKAQDKYATVEILQDGELLATGTGPTAAGDPITVTYKPSMVGKKEGNFTVRVTAQDGSVREYIVNYTNINYLKLSEDALLQDLMTDYGDLAPQFTPTIFSYDLAVKPDAERVGFTPRVRTPSSVIKVYREGDSRQIPPLDGKYWSQFLYYTEPEVVFNFIVFSQAAQARLKAMGKDIDKLDAAMVDDLVKKGFTANGTVEEFTAATGTDTTDNIGIRVYKVRVFVETDETKYDLKPITVKEIDLTADPIIVDITKYAVIEASVFAALKTDHGDKSVVLKGNDYTLEFQAKDININVPHTATFDFRMKFSTPDKLAIQDILNATTQNNGIVPVYMYSDYHGTLPAPMLLTVNLGRQYANNQLYWNYYNQERTRIDYYGYVFSNAKGSFTVPVDHFSTYIITDQRIYNAENKSGVDYGGVTMAGSEDGGLGGLGVNDMNNPTDNLGYDPYKDNPDTGIPAPAAQTPVQTAQTPAMPDQTGVALGWHRGFGAIRRRWRVCRRIS